MGMFDTIVGVPVKCPICGDEGGKKVQIKNGPQALDKFKFGKDKIPMDWSYEYYGCVIYKEERKDNGRIRGIAECAACRDRVNKIIDDIIKKYKENGKLKCPDGVKLLFECEIDGKNALRVVLDDLDKEFGGRPHSEYLFDVTIKIEDGIAIGADILKDEIG